MAEKSSKILLFLTRWSLQYVAVGLFRHLEVLPKKRKRRRKEIV
jgi:hypothetical protein